MSCVLKSKMPPLQFVPMLLAICMFCITSQSWSAERYIKSVEGEFDDVMFDLKDTIVNLGLVIERTGNIDDMLERTATVVEGANPDGIKTFTHAKYLLFCSAKLTHKATALDPLNISMCPFIIYAIETSKEPGKITLGYRNPDFGNLSPDTPIVMEVHAYLKHLIDSATQGY